MRPCEEYEVWISAFLDGELPGPERVELMKHMTACGRCQRYFDDLVAIHDALEQAEAPVPEGFAERVMTRVEETEQEKPRNTRSFPHWQQWAALAACCALALLGLWGIQSARGDHASGEAVSFASAPDAADAAGIPAALGEEDGTCAVAEDEAEAAPQLRMSGGEAPAQPEAAKNAGDAPASSPAAPSEYAADAAWNRDTAVSPEEAAPAPAAQELLTVEAAKAKALEYAGLTSDQVTFTEAKVDWENGREVYDIEFYTAGYKEYDYELDARTGELLEFDYDAESYAPPASSGIAISWDDAREAALAKVPGAAAEHVVKLELDRDDGRAIYEVEIVYNAMEYEMEISAADGTILTFEAESIYD